MEKMVVWKPCCFNGFEAKITIRKLFNIMISSVAAMVTGQLHEHNINKNKLFDPQKQYDEVSEFGTCDIQFWNIWNASDRQL